MAIGVAVEWGSTIYLKYECQELQADDSYLNITPDTYEAWLETAESKPQQVVQLDVIDSGETGIYYVRFYADKATIDCPKAYYIAFYYTYQGDTICQRELVKVLPDVR